MPENLRVFDKVGRSYGFISESAYVVDYEAKAEFFLSTAIYVNEDEVLNDGKYEYNKVGFPFMASLGDMILRHDRGRKRRHPPDLEKEFPRPKPKPAAPPPDPTTIYPAPAAGFAPAAPAGKR